MIVHYAPAPLASPDEPDWNRTAVCGAACIVAGPRRGRSACSSNPANVAGCATCLSRLLADEGGMS